MHPSPLVAGLLAVLVPGAGHVVVGSVQKGAVFLVVLVAMFLMGLGFGGELFPLATSEPLVALASVAQWAMAVPRAIAAIAGAGRGEAVASTYEYGNTFLIVSGLLNLLVALDAYDLAKGTKRS